MLTLATITLLARILLGMRFKVLVLALTVALTMVAVFAGGVAHHEEAGSIALAIVIAAVGLEVGYLGGLCVSQAMMVMRAARVRRAVPDARRAVSGHAH